MKITMARLYWDSRFRQLGGVVLLSVHDELTIQVPVKNFKRILPIIVAAFTDYNLSVPLKTSLDAGINFGELCGPGELPSMDVPWDNVPKWIYEDLKLTDVKDYDPEYTPESDIHFGDREWVHGKEN